MQSDNHFPNALHSVKEEATSPLKWDPGVLRDKDGEDPHNQEIQKEIVVELW